MARAQAAWRRRLVIFAKTPRLGSVKSRLAHDVGWVEATRWYRSAYHHTLLKLSNDPRWQTYLAIAPDSDVHGVRSAVKYHGSQVILAQGDGDLGQRMARLFQTLPPGPVILVGCDIPDMKASDIATAFAHLGSSDIVFGPASDGGYWLVGMKRAPTVPNPFKNVAWSTDRALNDTLANLQGSKVTFIRTLNDVDTAEDLSLSSNAPEDGA